MMRVQDGIFNEKEMFFFMWVSMWDKCNGVTRVRMSTVLMHNNSDPNHAIMSY